MVLQSTGLVWLGFGCMIKWTGVLGCDFVIEWTSVATVGCGFAINWTGWLG